MKVVLFDLADPEVKLFIWWRPRFYHALWGMLHLASTDSIRLWANMKATCRAKLCFDFKVTWSHQRDCQEKHFVFLNRTRVSKHFAFWQPLWSSNSRISHFPCCKAKRLFLTSAVSLIQLAEVIPLRGITSGHLLSLLSITTVVAFAEVNKSSSAVLWSLPALVMKWHTLKKVVSCTAVVRRAVFVLLPAHFTEDSKNPKKTPKNPTYWTSVRKQPLQSQLRTSSPAF